MLAIGCVERSVHFYDAWAVSQPSKHSEDTEGDREIAILKTSNNQTPTSLSWFHVQDRIDEHERWAFGPLRRC